MEGVGGSWQSDLQPYIIDQDRVICVWVFVVWVHVWVYEVLQVVVDCMWWNGPCCFGRLLLLTKPTTHNGHKSYLFKCSILTPAVRLTSYVFVSVCMSVCIHTYSYISIWVCLHVIGGVCECVGINNQQQSATGLTSSLAFAFLFLSVRSTVGSGSLIFVFVGFLMIVWIFFLFFAFAYKKRHFIRRLKVVLEKWSFSFLICTRFFLELLTRLFVSQSFPPSAIFFPSSLFSSLSIQMSAIFPRFSCFFSAYFPARSGGSTSTVSHRKRKWKYQKPPGIHPTTNRSGLRHFNETSLPRFAGKKEGQKIHRVTHVWWSVGWSVVRFAAWLSEWLLIQWLSIVPILFVCLVGCVFSFLHERKVFVVFLSKRITGKRRNVLCLVAFVYIWTNERTNECVDG